MKMVNASLNWASICGLMLFLLGLISAPASLANIYFLLNRRSDNTSQIIFMTIYRVAEQKLFGPIYPRKSD